MTHSYKAQVDCISVNYTYPSQMDAMWRATAQSQKYVDVMVATDIPREIIPYIVKRIIPNCQDLEYSEILNRLEVKPSNVERFLASAFQEMLDSLHENISMEKLCVSYHDNKLHFDWLLRNLDNDKIALIKYVEKPGTEITMEQFLKQNKSLTGKSINLTKRDIRKLFVIMKKIIKMFPRVSTKNTPLRGLYLDQNATE